MTREDGNQRGTHSEAAPSLSDQDLGQDSTRGDSNRRDLTQQRDVETSFDLSQHKPPNVSESSVTENVTRDDPFGTKDSQGLQEPGWPTLGNSDAISPGATERRFEVGNVIDSRYQIMAQLGSGGFGVVLRGFDQQLQRQVAIKIAHEKMGAAGSRAISNLSLHEARVVAGLRHQNIVRVFDVGRTCEVPFFIVSELIDGENLSELVKICPFTTADAIEIVAKIADALQYAHDQGVIHRDVKPANIMLDNDGEPLLTDFGLAVSRSTSGETVRNAGTPHYLSPEQAAGRDHRINHQCDIYSLGVTLYFLISGTLPYASSSLSKLLKLISNSRYTPLGTLVPDVPPKLDRILSRAIAKRQSDRYDTAAELADDLRALATELAEKSDASKFSGSARIIPQGLRSFDEHDSSFFLELLPGVRDTAGFPQSLRFWKHKLEQSECAQGAEVSLIFGPSGCGKSSFVKAGLIPNLAQEIVPIYLESSAADTERDAVAKIGRHVTLSETCVLADAVRLLCQSTNQQQAGGDPLIASNQNALAKRYVIFFDQFEQWLHQRGESGGDDLISALEACDGQNVQAVLMIRDDFWMSATRLMRRLDISIVEGRNSAAVDLFDLDHARHVLQLFGQANGDLPADASELTSGQTQFLHQAIDHLKHDDRVVCVQIALFAQMMKGRDWLPATLQQLGGSVGVGARFLDQTFGDRSVQTHYQALEPSVRLVLSALLPDHGADIKGQSRCINELRQISQLSPDDFDRLVQVLDQELRLITPVDSDRLPQQSVLQESVLQESGLRQPAIAMSAKPAKPRADKILDSESAAAYQLTHDFMVPSLREWLHQKQRETPHGRAELCLAERASLWEMQPERRHLPSFAESIGIWRRTDSVRWNDVQRQMMKSASRLYAGHALMAAFIVGLVIAGATLVRGHLAAERMQLTATAKVDSLLAARTNDVPRLVEELTPYRSVANQQLLARFDVPRDADEKLHAGLALATTGFAEPAFLKEALIKGNSDQVHVIREMLVHAGIDVSQDLWQVVDDGASRTELLAACGGLALLCPDDPKWPSVAERLSDALVQENPLAVLGWMELLGPLSAHVNVHLANTLQNDQELHTPAQREVAMAILSDFAKDDGHLLLELLVNSQQFMPLLFDVFSRKNEDAIELVDLYLAGQWQPRLPVNNSRNQAAKRQANVVLLAMKLGMQDRVWSYWRDSEDNTVRTEVLLCLLESNLPPDVLLQQVTTEKDASARAALLMGIGELVNRLTKSQAEAVAEQTLNWFECDPAACVHSACRWLIENRLTSDLSCLTDVQRRRLHAKLSDIESSLAVGRPVGDRQWYVTAQGGHSMTVILGPTEQWVGSTVDTAPSRDPDEPRRKRSVGRSFAIGQSEVTAKQFQTFWQQRPKLREFYGYPDDYYGNDDSKLSIERVNWFVAAEFCNWLSEQEGIAEDEWCFPKHVDRVNGITLREDYFERTGYRLLSETEWEIAARCGTLTNWYFGSEGSRLNQFAWWAGNADERIRPPALLRPNGYGLFDVYGNAMEWTVTGQAIDEDLCEDVLVHPRVDPLGSRILRGGGYSDFRACARSAYRESYTPDAGGIELGIRIGRTMPSQLSSGSD